MTTTDTSGATSDTSAAATITPAAAPAGTATHVSQAPTIDYQSTTPKADAPAAQPAAAPQEPNAEPAKAAEAIVEPAKVEEPAKPTDAPEFKLPDEYKDKAWASKIKSQDDLYKQIDNLQTLVGKKTVIPNLKDASPEEREAFYSQLRGKDATEYPIPDNPAFPTLPEAVETIPKLFMDNGVSPTQAEAIIKGYQEFGAKMVAKQYDPEEYKASMQTAFGNEWEKVTGQVRNTIKGMMNADDQKALDTIPNHLLGVVYRTLGNTVKAYGIKETDAAHFQGSGNAAPTDVASVREGLRNQLNALGMRPHTSQEKDSLIDQINATYKNDPRIQQAG